VSFLDVVDKSRWKVVLWKEVRAKWEVVDRINAFVTTMLETPGLIGPKMYPIFPEAVNLIGAIELFEEDNLLAQE